MASESNNNYEDLTPGNGVLYWNEDTGHSCVMSHFRNTWEVPRDFTGIARFSLLKSIIWFLDGQMHKTTGPCCRSDSGSFEYIIHGKTHRDDGPALYDPLNLKKRRWFIEGTEISMTVFELQYMLKYRKPYE